MKTGSKSECVLKPISKSNWDKSVGFGVLNKNAERFGQEKVFLGDLPTFASMTNDPSIMEILIRIEALERRNLNPFRRSEWLGCFFLRGKMMKHVLVALQLASKESIVIGRAEAMKTRQKRTAKKAFGTSGLPDLPVAPGQTVTIDLPSGVGEDSFKKFKSSCVVNGQIVAVPYDAEKILVVDPSSRQASAIDLPEGICPTEEEKFGSSCVVNGHVVGVPYNADKILVVDPASHQAFAIDLPPGISPDGPEKFCKSCSVNGQVVAVPKKAEKILVVDPASRKAFAIDLPEDSRWDVDVDFNDFDLYRSSSLVKSQVALPFDFEKILVVDPASRQVFTRRQPSLSWHSSMAGARL